MFPTLTPEFLSALQTVLFVLAVYLAVFTGCLAIWTFQDSRRRSRNWLVHLLAVILVLVFGLPGIVLYMLIRPKETLAQQYDRSLEEAAFLVDLDKQLACPRCKKSIQQEFIICPHCTESLKKACRSCGAALSAMWKACPYCTAPVAQPAAAAAATAPIPVLDPVPEVSEAAISGAAS